MWLGRYDEAIRHFKRTIELAPKLAHGYWGMGSLNYARGRYGDAVLAYREALARDSRHPNLWSEVAWLYMDLGLAREARSALDSQRQLDKSPADAMMGEAHVLLFESGPQALPAFLARNGLLSSAEPGIAADAMLLASMAGQPVDLAAVNRSVGANARRSHGMGRLLWLFLGECVKLQFATLYVLADQLQRRSP